MKTFVLAAFLLMGCIVAESEFHNDLPPGDLQKYFGVQVRENVPTYEIVSPIHIRGSRRRRSLFAAKEPLKYDLKAFGEEFKLHLEHNDELIAPGCLVHYMQTNGTKKVRPCPTHEDDCYYHGASLTHNGSDVALSTCSGLHGLIRLPDREHDLWIQPVEERHVDRARRSTGSTLAQPHIVYKRAVSDRRCAAEGVPEVSQLVSSAEAASRVRRGAGDKYAEMLLVADTTMAQHYKNKLREYLLTVANVAARVLLDPSIGTPLHFTVVKIQILDADQPGLVITENAEDSLDSFCTWQEKSNPRDDTHPQHYDGASLFTRRDIVHNGVRDTTGYATVAGMCGEKTRCSINEDNGLGVGLTLAHETGHTLGMVHDGSGNICENGKNVMSSMGGGGRTAMFWSSCSRQAYSDFLSTTKSECLNDHPQTSVAMPKDLPGVVYNGDEQCEMYVGPGSTICEGTSMVQGDECTHLVCFDPQEAGTCKGDSVPRLDGTMCGNRKYCMHGQCVDIGPNGPQPRNGGWSAWDAEWSECSRPCGGGVRVRRRKCDNPKPRLGGRDCPGSSIMAEMCNMQACKKSEEEFKAEQCAMTDSMPMNGQTHHWVPVNMLGEQECELHCRIDGQRTVLLRNNNGSSWYQDGTLCTSKGSFGRCVDGKCRSFGCDGKTESSYQFDRCGVCGGQSNSCSRQSGTFNKGRKQEYVTFLTMPKGSTAVKIVNKNKFTQMSVKVAGKRLFSEDGGEADQSGTYTAETVVVDYKSSSSGDETISITGPLPEPVEAQVWRKFDDSEFQGVAPQINYEYFVPSGAQPTSNYEWKTANGACTKSCGGGVYNRIITCTRRGTGAKVDDHFCDLRQKPAMTGSACNNQACPPRWRAGRYGQCSKTCGGGQQTRAVECVQAQGGREEVVAASNCRANSRPLATQRCNLNPCPAVWVTGDWSQCSLTCGKGVHTRTVQCVKDDASRQKVADNQCPANSKPDATEACVNAVCSPQITGDACKDTDATCAGYGLTMCQDYASFAKESCMKHCAFCTEDGTVGGVCENKNADCAGYGQSICTGEYAEWARSNCAKLCGYCGGGGTGTGGSAVCEDKNDQCSGYGESICTGEYADWAKENCAKLCGFCGGSTTTINNNGGTGGNGGSTGSSGSGACADKSGDCAGYGQSVCTGQYADWAKDNCAKYCGHCGGGGGVSGGSGGGTSSTAAQTTATTTLPQTTTTTTTVATTTTPIPTTTTTTTIATTPTTAAATKAESSNCKDVNSNCAAFGQSFCTQSSYVDWAKANCARYCNLCEENSVSTTTVATSTPKPTSAVSSTCVDVANNCEQYGAGFCSQPAYTAWAKENCARFCNLCDNSHDAVTVTVSKATSPKPASTQPSTTVVAAAACVDVNDNCAQYGADFCTQAAYADWARNNCAKHCQLCVVQSGTGHEDCVDKVTTCPQYGQSICSNQQYTQWVAANCAKFCGLCGSGEAAQTTAPAQTSPSPTTTTTTTTATTTTTPQATSVATSSSSCQDKVSNCAAYGSSFCTDQRYADFARDNCRRHCNFCASSSSTSAASSEACSDKLDNCMAYDKAVCQSADYKEWARSNCAKFCGFCTEGGAVAEQTTQPAQSTGGTTESGACQDVFDNCEGYGETVCGGQYQDWAAQNCRKFCNFCSGGTTGQGSGESGNGIGNNGDSGDHSGNGNGNNGDSGDNSGNGDSGNSGIGTSTNVNSACQDKSGDCSGYGQSVCTGQYADWAKDNCAKYCGHCGGSSSVGGGGGAVAASGSAGDCSDKADNCAAYGQSVCSGTYAEWAGDNCKKFCNLCSTSTASASAASGRSAASNCVDVSPDCGGYGASVCTSYADWAATNCQKFCNKCGNRRRRSVLAPPPPRPLCNNVLTDLMGSVSLIGRPVDSSCSQIIVAPVGSRIQLSFTALRISCKEGDWLEVREEGGKRKGRKMKRDLCGQPAPVQWTTTGHIVTIKMSIATPGHGYNMTYRVEKAPEIKKGCDRLLTDPSGAVASPGFPALYGHNQLCLTTIVAPPNYTIRLNFDLFRLESQKCGRDTVTVYDEEYGNKDVFCGTWPDLTWQSKGNRVKVIFASDQIKNGPGFLASYKFIAP